MDNPKQEPTTRWQFFRDIIVFQVKLIIDGLRDALLIPTSLVAGLVGLVTHPSDPGTLFYRLVQLGKRSEAWINLFGAAPTEAKTTNMDVRPLDSLIKDLENSVVDQYNRGGVTAKAKDAIDSALDTIGKLRSNDTVENPGNSRQSSND